MNEIANTLLRVAKRQVSIEYAPPRPGEQQHSYLNIAKAGKVFDWKPSVSLDQGLKETFDWFEGRQRAADRAAQV